MLLTGPSKRLSLLLFFAASNAAIAAEPPVVAVKPPNWKPRRPAVVAEKPRTPVPLLIERLRNPRFVERSEASRELARGGLAAVAPLQIAATDAIPEVSIRAVAALERIWLRALEDGDDAAADAALTALDELSVAGDPAQQARIEALLASYEPLIEKFAINEIRCLGGSVRLNESVSRIGDDGMYRPEITHVVIGTAWSGGEEGLRHIRRARPKNGVYFVRGAKLPEGAAERFNVATNIDIAIRGPAYLGVVGSTLLVAGVDGCIVSATEPGTPAEKAGIRQGDVIVEFNGKKIPAFPQLVKEIENTLPGQTVDAVVRRQEPDPNVPGSTRTVLKTLKVTMEEWK